MIPLAIGVAVLDEHTGLTCLETNASLFTAIGTAADRRIVPRLILDHSVVVEVVVPNAEVPPNLWIFVKQQRSWR